MAYSVFAQKLLLWFQRYKITPQEYNNWLQRKQIPQKGTFKEALQELLNSANLFLLTDFYSDDVDESLSPNTIYSVNIDNQSFNPIFTLSTSERDDYDRSILYIPEQNSFYYFARVQDYELQEEGFRLEKIDIVNETITIIPLTGDVYDPGEFVGYSNFINDGGDDMYDGGNFLNTNLTQSVDPSNINNQYYEEVGFIKEKSISYTHVKQPNDTFVFIGETTINSELEHFGPNSKYFTNLYPGFFVLAAEGVAINQFSISGNLGADGSGIIQSGKFTINNNNYDVFYKKVYSSNDPSVHHLIIVPANPTLLQSVASSTNHDNHLIYNSLISGSLFYLCLSTATSEEIPNNILETIATTFVNYFDGESLNTGLNNLNNDYNTISNLIPNRFDFSDNGEAGEFINSREGIDQVEGSILINNEIFLFANNGFWNCTLNGEITQIFDRSFNFNGVNYYLSNNLILAIDDYDFYWLSGEEIPDGEFQSVPITINESDPALQPLQDGYEQDDQDTYGLAIYNNEMYTILRLVFWKENDDELFKYYLAKINFQGELSTVFEIPRGVDFCFN